MPRLRRSRLLLRRRRLARKKIKGSVFRELMRVKRAIAHVDKFLQASDECDALITDPEALLRWL